MARIGTVTPVPDLLGVIVSVPTVAAVSTLALTPMICPWKGMV